MDELEITPVDIRHKEFSNSMFGYSKSEVKQFLEIISNQLEDLVMKLSEYESDKSKNIKPKSQPIPPPQPKPVKKPKKKEEPKSDKEELISKTLMLAEKTKEEILNNARKEAENILKEADYRSKKSIEDAKHFLNVLEHQYINIKEQKKQFLIQFRSELQGLLQRINSDSLINKETESKMDKTFEKIKNMKDKAEKEIKNVEKNKRNK